MQINHHLGLFPHMVHLTANLLKNSVTYVLLVNFRNSANASADALSSTSFDFDGTYI